MHGTGQADKPFVSTFLLGVIEVENDDDEDYEEDYEVRALWEQSIPSPNDQLTQAAAVALREQPVAIICLIGGSTALPRSHTHSQ